MKKKDLIFIGAGAVAVFAVLGVGTRLHRAGSEALKPLSTGIGSMLASVSMALNGSHAIEFSRAGFYLADKYIDGQGRVSPVFIDAIKNTHPDNAPILAQLLTPDGRLKQGYCRLIGTTVTREDI